MMNADEQSGQDSQSLRAREEALAAREKDLKAVEETAARVRVELDVVMEALREANAHLVVANLRSQALAEQMTQLYEDAAKAIKARDDFFALLSHELRTPLTSIKGWADLLARRPDPETIAEAARSIASSAVLQAKLVDDLLDVSRIMTGKFEITEAEMDLGAVVTEAMSAQRPMAEQKGLALRVVEHQPVPIRGDAVRLHQVIENLLANALKFTPAGGLIEVRLRLEDSLAVVEVCDTGEGISPSFLPHVFDRHSQASTRRFGGLGLGLAIVKHIVELHRGSIEATSGGEGLGATFLLRIPILTRE